MKPTSIGAEPHRLCEAWLSWRPVLGLAGSHNSHDRQRHENWEADLHGGLPFLSYFRLMPTHDHDKLSLTPMGYGTLTS
jgi:hypothetical protein